MALSPNVDRLGEEFGPFLRSHLWEERDAMPLSVLSAFARLDMDPWLEAAGLAQLPRNAAAERLRQLLSGLPGCDGVPEVDALCRRSAALLPNPEQPVSQVWSHTDAVQRERPHVAVAFHFLALAACMALATVLADHMETHPPANAAAVSQPSQAAAPATPAS